MVKTTFLVREVCIKIKIIEIKLLMVDMIDFPLQFFKNDFGTLFNINNNRFSTLLSPLMRVTLIFCTVSLTSFSITRGKLYSAVAFRLFWEITWNLLVCNLNLTDHIKGGTQNCITHLNFHRCGGIRKTQIKFFLYPWMQISTQNDSWYDFDGKPKQS